MDDQFRPIYERLYEGYRRTSTILPRYGGETLAVAKEVSDVIEQVQSQLNASSDHPPMPVFGSGVILLP
jgi:hypothetical protein